MFFPKLVIGVLIILGSCIIITEIAKKIRNKEPIIPKCKIFFVADYDKLKLFGSLILFVLYVAMLDRIGFIPASLIFIFMYNILFCGILQWKSLLISAVITVVFVVGIWFIFGVMFNISLP